MPHDTPSPSAAKSFRSCAAHLLCESISQGMPVLNTNRMPVRVVLSGTHGLPPLGLGGSSGNSGSIAYRSSSLTSSLAVFASYSIGGFC
jgi:hypothetical protein